MTVHAFVDTNIRLHYKPLEEIDWCAVVGADDVVLHIATVTTHEMDEHKYSSTEKIKRRAERILRADNARLESSDFQIREQVSIVFEAVEPGNDLFDTHRLNARSKDGTPARGCRTRISSRRLIFSAMTST